MTGITLTRRIAAPVETVFTRASDFAGAPKVISGITKVELLTSGPVGRGTKFRETRTMFGREHAEVMEVVEFEAPRRYVLAAQSHGCQYRSELLFRPAEGGTEVAMTFEAKPLTVLARILSVLTRPMMKSVATMCAKDLDDLKAAIETRP